MTPASLILASGSQARIALVKGAGIAFQAHPADLDEAAIRDDGLADGATPTEIASRLAVAKAETIAARFPEAVVLGSDQVLVHGPDLLSKPDNLAEARAQLAALRNDTHSLISAAALVRGGTLVWEHAQSVDLTMRDFSDAFLDDYLRRMGDNVLSSAGSYHLEGLGAHLFTRVDGDYFTVLGLPLLAVLQALRDIGHLGA